MHKEGGCYALKIDFTVKFNEAAIEEIEKKARRHVNKAAEHIQTKMKKKVSQDGSGAIYQGKRASAPGEPPAIQSGTLANSIKTESSPKIIGNVIESKVKTSGVPYAKRLEYGFFGRDALGRYYNQAPRPYFKKTAMEELAAVKSILKRGR